MKSNNAWRIKLGQILLGAAFLLALVIVRGTHAGNEPIHMTTDWSHRHVVFSAPKNLGQHVQLLSNPRYVQQLVRRDAGNHGDPGGWKWRRAPEPGNPLHGDWSMFMGVGATVGAGNYPAKYSFDSTSANCSDAAQPDFVVYNTSVAGSNTVVAASQTVTFGSNGSNSPPTGTVIITNGVNVLTLTGINPGLSSGTNFHVDADNGSGNRTGNATSLAAAINLAGNGSSVGVSASTGGTNTVTITATTAGAAGNLITLTGTIEGLGLGVSYGGNTFSGGLSLQATVGAFDNLYSTCNGFAGAGGPNTYWAYNTGNNETIATSPVLSGDGKQIAVIEYGSAPATATASLVLIKWAANDGNFTTPTVPVNSTTSALYNSCVPVAGTPCMFTIAFSNSNGGADALDTNSSPFYDYAHDTLYVGNDNGFLHKFTPVFKGAPAEVVSTAGANRWPAVINTGNVLTSPVFDDDATPKVFIGDNASLFYRVDSTLGSGGVGKTTSAALGTTGIDDSPVLDPTADNVYVFERSSGGGGARAKVYRFTAGFTGGTTGSENQNVSSSTTVPVTALYAGDFDNIYYSSINATGSMYICGTNAGLPAIWRIPIAAGVLGTPVAGPTLTTTNVACSGITEFNNGATDRMFLSVTNDAITGTSGGGAAINCPIPSGGCIMSFDITTTTGWGVAKGTSATAAEAGGTSGIVIDNSSAFSGASQIYFTPLASQLCMTSNVTGGCAIQAAQVDLK